ncbi:MAG: tRNA (guanosine(46)-N7)-methyltransferase TrmB [Hyphomicrobiaceae bacterium]|nr:tRNA (guanosine(46)-N7)-methyltransferase TrmB [Hyphomicrobiaceae bacterium]
MAGPDDESARRQQADLRSFGRRRGRKATARQRTLLDDLLPRVAIVPEQVAGLTANALPAAVFGTAVAEVWLEIGFGGGEHLLWQAHEHPDVGLIGCEPFEDGVVKVLSAMDGNGPKNIRLLADDVRPLLRALPAASLSRVFILFPDPWPKRRHAKRRLIDPAFVADLARVMRPGGQLRFATDIGDYARTALLSLNGNENFIWRAASPEDWRFRSEDWPGTRYEAKASREGRRSYYFRFCRR